MVPSCRQGKRLTDALNDKKGVLLYWYGMVWYGSGLRRQYGQQYGMVWYPSNIAEQRRAL